MLQFLEEQMLTAACYDLQAEISRFQKEMSRGLKGEPSSLFMIPTFLSPEAGNIADQTIIVLDAGGTNLRVGSVAFRDGVAADVEFEKFPLPGTDRELTVTEFFDAVAEKLAPYLDRSDKIGFCFSYAAHSMENKDAKMVAFCKEVKVTGAEGVEICKALDEAIRRRGVEKTYSYVQLNDTVATLLGGMAAADRAKYDAFIGFILGTGTNGCYVESTKNIEKYTGSVYTAETMIVNMESGCYAGYARGDIDCALDASSAIPGDHQAEKLISGAYMGVILAQALRAANLMTDARKEIPMPDVNAFLAGEKSVLDDIIQDRDAVRAIIEGIYSRTARLMTVVFASIALHRGVGKEKPVAIVLEGSTYQKSPRLQQYLAEELADVKAKYGVLFEIVGAENATLTGSAYAAVSNA